MPLRRGAPDHLLAARRPRDGPRAPLPLRSPRASRSRPARTRGRSRATSTAVHPESSSRRRACGRSSRPASRPRSRPARRSAATRRRAGARRRARSACGCGSAGGRCRPNSRRPSRRPTRALFAGLRERLGLDRLAVAGVGAAPCAAKCSSSSTRSASSCSRPGRCRRPPAWASRRAGQVRIGTVGRPLPGSRSGSPPTARCCCAASRPWPATTGSRERTLAAIDPDGWLHTGDIGASTPTATCRSSTARRSSSSPPAARTSPPRASRANSRPPAR